MAASGLSKADGGWHLPIVGQLLTQVAIDDAVSLHFIAKGPQSTIRLGQTFTIQSLDRSAEVVPEQRDTIRPVLDLLFAQVARAVAAPDGTLTVVFEDQRIITASPVERFESWEFIGADGSKVVCCPGGGLALWS